MNRTIPHPRPTSSRRRHPRAAAATEYITVLAIVVIPLAICIDTYVLWPGTGTQSKDVYIQQNLSQQPPKIMPTYEHRITSTILLPVG